MSVAATTACALCLDNTVRASGARGAWDLRRCSRCGHVQAADLPSAADLQRRHFDDDFADNADPWTALFDRWNGRRVARALHCRLTGGYVLEIGPGRGATLAALAGVGFEVSGLDVSPAVAASIERRLGLHIGVGDVEAFARDRSRRGSYDAVVLRHVLEHFSRPEAVLATTRALLRPGGWLYIAVPNAAAAEAVLPGWTGYQPYHLHYFSASNLCDVVRRAGFEVEQCATREPFSGWFNALMGSMRRRPAAEGQEVRSPAGPMHHAVQAVRLASGFALTPVRLIQARLGYGEEIELWARKRQV
jgi:2-polyprenyl-3-methyl-5-hydroxy-6-metoxy-1,4-benzoquinol methylase